MAPAPKPMTIMEHIHSGLSALRAHLEANDAALHSQILTKLDAMSPAAYTHCFSEDHDYAPAIAMTQAM
jgi:predicted component of type VI protein secretion system